MMTGREIVFSRFDEVYKVVFKCINKNVVLELGNCPIYIRHDVVTEPEDLAHDCMTHILERADKYDPERAQLSTWVWSVTLHYCHRLLYDVLQSDRRRPPRDSVVSLDAPIRLGDDSDVSLFEVLPSKVDIEGDYIRKEDISRAKRIIDKVSSDRDKEILDLRLNRGMSLDEVGNHFGITRERVRQVQTKTFRRLRAAYYAEDRKKKVRKEKRVCA